MASLHRRLGRFFVPTGLACQPEDVQIPHAVPQVAIRLDSREVKALPTSGREASRASRPKRPVYLVVLGEKFDLGYVNGVAAGIEGTDHLHVFVFILFCAALFVELIRGRT